MIRLEHIYKFYGKNRVLKDINFGFKNKGLYLLKGENGSGKTTLLNIISSKDLNYEGKVEIVEDIFYLPFDNYLVKEFSVKENIKLAKDILRISKK